MRQSPSSEKGSRTADGVLLKDTGVNPLHSWCFICSPTLASMEVRGVPPTKEVRVENIVRILLAIGWTVVGLVIFWFLIAWIVRVVEPLISKVFDFLWLPSSMPWVMQEGEKLQLVIDKNLMATAGWVTFSSSLAAVGAGFVFGLLVVIVEFLYRFYVIVTTGLISEVVPEMNYWYFLVGFVVPFFILPLIYWVKAWESRHSRLVITNMFMVEINVRPTLFGKDPDASFGDLIPCKELLAGTDIDRLTKNMGPSRTGALQDLWNRLLYSKSGTGYLIIPSAMQFATNIIGGVDWCMSTNQIIRALAVEAEKIKVGLQGNLRTGTFKVADLEALRAKVGKDGKVIDLLTADDPGIWDRRNGQSVIPASTDAPAMENPWPAFRES